MFQELFPLFFLSSVTLSNFATDRVFYFTLSNTRYSYGLYLFNAVCKFLFELEKQFIMFNLEK